MPDDVKPGFYFLISSADDSFRENNNQTQTATVWISDLSLVVRSRANRLEGFVVEGNSGDPVVGAQVDVWLLGNRGKYVKKNGITDESGMFSIQKAKNQYQGFILAQHNERRVGTTGRNNYWGGQVNEPKSQQMTLFFTDRAIYRPGQTVKFKGIALAWHQGKDDYNIMLDKKITVSCCAIPTAKRFERLDLKTNGYGSLSGKFYRAKGTLNGQLPDCNLRGASWPGILSRGGIQATEVSRRTGQAGAVAQVGRDRSTQRQGDRLHRRADRLGQGQVSRHAKGALASLVALALLEWRADPFAGAADRPWHIRNQAGWLVHD